MRGGEADARMMETRSVEVPCAASNAARARAAPALRASNEASPRILGLASALRASSISLWDRMMSEMEMIGLKCLEKISPEGDHGSSLCFKRMRLVEHLV